MGTHRTGPESSAHGSGDADRSRLVEALRMIERLQAALKAPRETDDEPIAVVGMGCRMPGGGNGPDGFWRVLRDGVDATSEFPSDRADAHAVYDPDPDARGRAYVIRGGFLDEEVDRFEPAVFGISPREAVGMDPQQRLSLRVAWEALEHAGYAPDTLEGSRTGVFLGVSTTDYVRLRQQIGDPADIDAYQLIGEPSFMAGRISFALGLMGPSEVVDTTCSSSLVALHLACQALRLGECDMALAGGVNLMLAPYGFVLMSKFRALAADGRCKTFDASADGYARGEGAGIVVLKRLSAAQRAGDTIHAVVRGTAVNHDGRSSGITVPNPASQQAVIEAALRRSRIDPADIGYVEAHGTGTSLGDPIELNALETTLGRYHADGPPLLVGSVKTNIGHLESAAGVAGLLKLILALRYGQIPPHLHLRNPNPNVDWKRLHIEVPTGLRPWATDGRPRVGAVSSFGASGTNAHAVVAQAPPGPEQPRPRRLWNVLTLSARSTEALADLAARYADDLTDRADADLADVCYTSHVGRARMPYGVAVTGRSMAELVHGLTTYLGGGRDDGVVPVTLAPHRRRKVAWLFTGQGSQYQGMGRGMRDEPAYRAAFDEVASLMDGALTRPLGELVDAPDDELDETGNTQPALFAVEYALARTWLSWGVRPGALIGHSLGEIVAACIAGVLDVEDAVRLVTERARLMQALPAGGAMATLVCDEVRAGAAIAEYRETVSIAASNGPADTVIAGPVAELRKITDALAAEGVKSRMLRVSHAFHSPLMAPAMQRLRAVARTIRHRPPRIPVISNVTGRQWGPLEADPEYWVRHAMSTVRFQDGIRTLHHQGYRTFLEIGPQPVLLGLGSRAFDDPDCAWIASLRRGHDDQQRMLTALGAVHLRGMAVDWSAFHEPEQPRRVPLPTYAWRGERYWFPERENGPAVVAESGEPVDGVGMRLPGPLPTYAVDLADPRWSGGAQPVGGNRLAVAPDLLVRTALAAAADGVGGGWRGVEALRPGEPLVLGEDRRVRLVLTPAGDGTATDFAYRSASPAEEASGAQWRTHLSGVLTRRDTAVDLISSTVDSGVPGEPWGDPERLLMRMTWQPVSDDPARDMTGRQVLMLGDHAFAPELARELTSRGATCEVLPAPPAAPGSVEALAEVVRRWRGGHPGPGQVVLLGALTAPEPTDDPAALERYRDRTDLFTVAVVQALLSAAPGDDVRLTLLTRGAVDTGTDQSRHDPFGATGWGIGRVLALEHPELWAGAVDLDPDAPADDPVLVADGLCTLSTEDQLALRSGVRLAARVVPSALTPAQLRREATVRPDGSYLVTGAFGGIGQSLARWLAARGAGRLILLGRTALPDRDGWDDPGLPEPVRARVEFVRDLERAGAEVEVVAADVTEPDRLRAIVSTANAGRYPLRGVVHAAGVSVPQFAREVRTTEYDQVWRPKVVGGWALHQATLGIELDFFLLFSSIAATWGSQHLTSYAAANAFLDGLAAYRRSVCEPALSIAWSSWELPSSLFDADVVEFLKATGLRLLAASQCLRFIGALLASSETNHVVCAADWARYKAVLEARAERPVLRAITVAEDQDPGDGTSAFAQELLTAVPAQRRPMLDRYLRRQLAQILRVELTSLDGEFHLLEMGLDSLMVMELISRVRKDLRVEFKSPEFFACDANEWADFLLRLVESRHGDSLTG